MDKQNITHIVAIEKSSRAIGYKNELLFNVQADMKHFQNTTSNHVVLMGRRTHESIGSSLPNRVNIVLSRNPEYKGCDEKVIVVHNLSDALDVCRQRFADKNIYIIGGSELYWSTLPLVNKVIVTELEGETSSCALKTHFYPTLPARLVHQVTQDQDYDIQPCRKTNQRVHMTIKTFVTKK